MHEAVTAIFVCGTEVFVIRRQNHLRAFPGYTSFPGGKVDEGDLARKHRHPLLAANPDRLMSALVRELDEELGFDLPLALEQGEVKSLRFFGEAVTPPFERLRFNAHYYKIELARRPEFRLDSAEIAWADWLDHRELYRLFLAGQALMVVPVINVVRTLAEKIASRSAEPLNLQYDAERELPFLEQIHGLGLIPVPSNTLPPAKSTNALLFGDASNGRILVDPSPASESVYLQLRQTLVRRPPTAIFISHHHKDHHEMAPRLARELKVQLLCSAPTLEYLRTKYAPEELDGIDLATVEEGEVLTRWLGQPVRCYALPGHDAGMLGLAPDNLAWFFFADLAQAGATVVIPDEGGDMQSYYDSLQCVIELNPRILVPSHGVIMGGVHLLETTLEHRRQREAQVRCRVDAGKSLEEIVAELYGHLEPRLQQFARQNIKQHLKLLTSSAESQL
jgi:glyoxylase-like metal-dependent hydrolase (beta-lactamase superfamily II)/8-oxo-dGTP pyrophosphatase MutT (NUDIX family)